MSRRRVDQYVETCGHLTDWLNGRYAEGWTFEELENLLLAALVTCAEHQESPEAAYRRIREHLDSMVSRTQLN